MKFVKVCVWNLFVHHA